MNSEPTTRVKKAVRAAEISWRQLRSGAVIGAVIWQVLQYSGTYFVSHQLAHASSACVASPGGGAHPLRGRD